MITVETKIQAPMEKVWDYFTKAEHIKNWYNASSDWHAPYAENDLKIGGKFKTTMAAKDGTVSFDFEGTYTNVQKHQLIEYILADDRKVKITFSNEGNAVHLTETFDPESINTPELQKTGWQAILDNFKKYVDEN